MRHRPYGKLRAEGRMRAPHKRQTQTHTHTLSLSPSLVFLPTFPASSTTTPAATNLLLPLQLGETRFSNLKVRVHIFRLLVSLQGSIKESMRRRIIAIGPGRHTCSRSASDMSRPEVQANGLSTWGAAVQVAFGATRRISP